MDVTDELIVEITMLNANVAPYSSFELFGIENYKIMDTEGNVVDEKHAVDMSSVTNGKVRICVSLENVSAGEYVLIVNELVGSSKADHPLVLSGIWECEFTH